MELYVFVLIRSFVKFDNYKWFNNRDDDFVIIKFIKIVLIDKKEIDFFFLEEFVIIVIEKLFNILVI